MRAADPGPGAGAAAAPVVALLLAGVLATDGVLVLTRSGAAAAAQARPAVTAPAVPGVPAVPVPTDPAVPAVPAPAPVGPLRLGVPALGITAEAQTLGTAADGTLEVPATAQGVGWYSGSAVPGDVGPAVFAGHVDLDGRPGVFSALADLRPGSQVSVQRPDGRTVRFAVVRVEQHAKSAFPTTAVYGPTDAPELRLITCGGSFDRTRGSYRDNVVVFARQV